MSKLSKLLMVTEEQKAAILKKFNVTESDYEASVRHVKEWIGKSEHLPKDDADVDEKIRVALFNAKMNREKAKQTLEAYYTIRTVHGDILFDKMIPFSTAYEESKKLVMTVPLPKLTPDLCRVTIFKHMDPEGQASDALIYEIIVMMMAEIRMQKDAFASNIIVIDFEHFGWRNLTKFTPAMNAKLLNIMLSINLRIKSINFVNSPAFISHMMQLLRSMLPSKIVNRIYVHDNYDELLKEIPKDILPSTYGGTEKPLEELYAEWCQTLEELAPMFKNLLTLKSTKKIELDESSKKNLGLGVDGSFKSLAID